MERARYCQGEIWAAGLRLRLLCCVLATSLACQHRSAPAHTRAQGLDCLQYSRLVDQSVAAEQQQLAASRPSQRQQQQQQQQQLQAPITIDLTEENDPDYQASRVARAEHQVCVWGGR